MMAKGRRQAVEPPDPAFFDEVRAARRNRELITELARWRNEHGLTQAEVAKRMHTSQPAVARIESHQHDVQLSTLARYVTALGLLVNFDLIDRETGERLWTSADPSSSAEASLVQQPEQDRYISISSIDRWRAVPFDMTPVPERDAVQRRIRQLIESLEGAIDEGTGSALDPLIESWVADWIATVEADYIDHRAVISVHRDQASQWLAQTTAVARQETEELDRIRTELLQYRAQSPNEPTSTLRLRRLARRERLQATRVAKAAAERDRARAAVELHSAELDREDQRHIAAIAERTALGAMAANYATVLMAKMMKDPAKTGITDAGPVPNEPSDDTTEKPPHP